MIPEINKPFKVSFNRDKYSFIGVIVSIDRNPLNTDRQYKIEQSKRIGFDASGNPYLLKNSVIEVERNWFNKETGRKISIL